MIRDGSLETNCKSESKPESLLRTDRELSISETSLIEEELELDIIDENNPFDPPVVVFKTPLAPLCFNFSFKLTEEWILKIEVLGSNSIELLCSSLKEIFGNFSSCCNFP
ncbi:unnamed protein product [Ambrosiozyma monospora]|uniref:Unnamed protein product n=1 Tax=Ambrosiozyma monospora TaxID=43982 RepID=A0ACB5U7K0_AMBMO|nr:unnamed protein product [Ambrosiozyma monospora]